MDDDDEIECLRKLRGGVYGALGRFGEDVWMRFKFILVGNLVSGFVCFEIFC